MLDNRDKETRNLNSASLDVGFLQTIQNTYLIKAEQDIGEINCYNKRQPQQGSNDYSIKILFKIGGRLLLAGHCTETPSWNWNFGLKISASRVLWDIGFRLPGFFGILDFGFPGSLGYWILAFRVLLDSFFTGIGKLSFLYPETIGSFIQHAIQLGDPELVIWGFEGPRRDWIPISKVQDAHLETLTLTSGLRIWIQNFFLWIYLTMADFILT
ncbi:hypothetical protein GLOIN_2v1776594 [Rhizophagus irregularis DAOM 181602=DAOM 197198]|nr:hypothetical protein GLOIN_2v1776594 [Rhizophagus irregularis DAOM 181602=DAOM 197198]